MKIIIEDIRDSAENNYTDLIEKTVNMSIVREGNLLDPLVNIYITDNEGIREINQEYRNIDKPTDVLSFPILEIKDGVLEDSTGDIDPETGLIILGDIFISIEKAVEQASCYGHSIEREIAFLITHGVLHLLGYDHIEKAEEKIMIEKQESILKELGLTRIED